MTGRPAKGVVRACGGVTFSWWLALCGLVPGNWPGDRDTGIVASIAALAGRERSLSEVVTVADGEPAGRPGA